MRGARTVGTVLEILVLGPLDLRISGESVAVGGAKQRLVLAVLAMHAGDFVSRDALVDALWPEEPPPSARHTIESYVSRLRSLMRTAGSGDVIESQSGAYRLLTDGLTCDSIRFKALARAGEDALRAGDVVAANEHLGAALELWRGAAVEGLADHPVLRADAAGLDERRRHVLEIWADTELRLGRHGELSARLRTECARNPGRERLHELLILALYRASGQADALDAYRQARQHLSTQLGLEPGASLRELQAQVLRQDPALAAASTSPSGSGGASVFTSVEPISLPEPLLLRDSGAFVGRASDLDRLSDLYDAAKRGARQVALLAGEAGIGKTRLCMEFATKAHREGATVVYGRCDEEQMLSFQPFVEGLRHYVSETPSGQLAGQLGMLGGELRRILPELADLVPEVGPAADDDPGGARFRLFEAVSGLLWEAAHAAPPLVVVLDDLHWADKPTLLLLKFLARYPRQAPLLVLGTYRQTEIQPGHLLSDTIADLSRDGKLSRHGVERLDAAAVAELVDAHALPTAPGVREKIYEGTDGNPFFVVEVLRHLHEAGVAEGQLAVPEGVKDVIARRLTRLGDDVNQTLRAASILGRNFDLATLGRISDLSESRLVDVLEEATRSHVLEEISGAYGEYAFSHALTRETVYGSISGHRRALLHRDAAGALEAAHAGDLEPRRSELAHHFECAGAPDDLRRAIEHGTRAGEREVAQLAYEPAAVHFRRAAALLDGFAAPEHAAQHCDLVIAQGEAERQAGDPSYRATLLRAAHLAEAMGDGERLARAALVNNRDMFSSAQGVDRERVAVLQSALAALAPQDSLARAELLAVLSAELLAGSDWQYRADLADEALAMARRLGDPRTLARVLNRRFVALWGPKTLDERLANMLEVEQIASEHRDPVVGFYAAGFGAHAAMEAGELEHADRLLARLEPLAEQLGQPMLHWYDRVSRAKRFLLTGSPLECERLAAEAFELGEEIGQPDARSWFLVQTFAARLVSGRLNEGRPNFPKLAAIPGLAVPVVPEFTEGASVPLLMTAMRTVTFCEVGRLEEGRRHFERLMAEHRLENLPHDYATLALACLAASGCASLGDAHRAARIHDLIAPYTGQWVDGGTSWLGAADHYLALLEATMGHHDEADAHFKQASAAYEALGAQAWLARMRVQWADALIARGGAGAARRAGRLNAQALAMAQELGLEGIAAQVAPRAAA